MNYIEFKNIEQEVANSKHKNFIAAISYLTDSGVDGLYHNINNRLNNYKYTHSDLTKQEFSLLLKMNNIKKGSWLIGGEVHQTIKRNEECFMEKVYEIDLFKILNQIQHIIGLRKVKKLQKRLNEN